MNHLETLSFNDQDMLVTDLEHCDVLVQEQRHIQDCYAAPDETCGVDTQYTISFG